jgi:hypothetical protein
MNRAKAKGAGRKIFNSPGKTAAGLLFANGLWNTSLIYKRTGASYQQDFDLAKPATYEFAIATAYNIRSRCAPASKPGDGRNYFTDERHNGDVCPC